MKGLLGIAIACIAGAVIGYAAAIAIFLALMLWLVSVAWSQAARIARGI